MSKKVCFLISFVLVLSLGSSASAQDANHICFWSNQGDSNLWSDANNWYTVDWNGPGAMWDETARTDATWAKSDANIVPTLRDIASIGKGTDWFPYPDDLKDIGPIGSCLIDSSVTAECYQLFIGADTNEPNQPSHLSMTGGTLTVRVQTDDWIGVNIGGFLYGAVGSMTVSGNSIVDINYANPADPFGGLLDIGGGIDITPGDFNGVGTMTMLDDCIVRCYHFDCPDTFGDAPQEGHFNLWGGTLYCLADNVDWTIFWLGETGSAQTSTFDVRDGKAIMSSSGIEFFGPEQMLNAILGWIDEGKITAFGNDPNVRSELFVDWNITNPGKTTLSAIATLPEQAWNPKPRPSARVDFRPILTWTPGDFADTHVVYFSTDRAAVINNTAPSTPRGPNDYDPGILEFETAYYWRVDEVNDANLWLGVVWDFKTDDHLDVDDMDSYVNDAAINAVWTTGTLAGNGAELFVETRPAFVRARQSMKYRYRNTTTSKGKFVGSEAEASAADLEIGTDWVSGGPEALVLYFYGAATNLDDTSGVVDGIHQDQMYVAVDDGSTVGIVKYPDMNDIKEPSWHEWNIDLQDPSLTGVDMNNVAKVYIGFGGQKMGQTAKGAGKDFADFATIWFDDISLYPPRCVPDKVPTDITRDDCFTDHQDMGIMARDWLDSDANVAASAPLTGPVAFYQFEVGGGDPGSDTIVNSGSLSGADGTIFADGNRPTWVCPTCLNTDPCAPHAKCMEFDGFNDFVGIPDFNSISGGFTTDTMTITAWVKRDGDQVTFAGIMFSTRNDGTWDGSTVHAGLSFGAGAAWAGWTENKLLYHWDGDVGWPLGGDYIQDFTLPDGQWTFVAVSVEPTQATLYLMPAGGTLISETLPETHIESTFDSRWTIGMDERDWDDARNFKGRIDDVRVFDYALPIDKILFLAGVPGSVYVPLVSPANLDPKVGPFGWDENNVDIIDFRDYAVLADNWLVGPILWP